MSNFGHDTSMYLLWPSKADNTMNFGENGKSMISTRYVVYWVSFGRTWTSDFENSVRLIGVTIAKITEKLHEMVVGDRKLKYGSWKLYVYHMTHWFRFRIITWVRESYLRDGYRACSHFITNAIVWQLRMIVWFFKPKSDRVLAWTRHRFTTTHHKLAMYEKLLNWAINCRHLLYSPDLAPSTCLLLTK